MTSVTFAGRRSRVAALLFVSASVAFVSAVPAVQAHDGMSPAAATVATSPRDQASLMEAADAVLGLAAREPALTAHYAGLELGSAHSHTVIVHWVGTPDPKLVTLAAELAKSGVVLTFSSAHFSLDMLRAASDDIAAANEKNKLGIRGIAIATDGSGLTVGSPLLPNSSDVTMVTLRSPLVTTLQQVANRRGIVIATRSSVDAKGVPGGALMPRHANG